MKCRHLRILTSVGLALLLQGPSLALAQSLGNAKSFAILGGSAVTVAGSATINGDVGVSPGTSITGIFTPVAPYGKHSNDAAAIAAQSAATALYTSLDTMGSPTVLGNELGGITLNPGTYSIGAANIANNATLHLSGVGTYVIQVGSSLTANTGSNVSLENGASACDVFWQVTSAATLLGNSFAGTVVAQAGVTLGSGATLNGRALALSLGAVTLSGSNNTVTLGTCNDGPPASFSPTLLKSFSPNAIGLSGVSTLTITLRNPNATAANLTAAFTDTLPSGVVIAATPDASTTCGGSGAVAATPNGTTVTVPTTRSIPAGIGNTPGTCTVTVNVTAAAAGSYVNTLAVNALQTSNGNNAAPASATLLVAQGVPTLPWWAMIMLTALMALAGFAALRRRTV